MAEMLDVKAAEHGIVRIFQVDIDEDTRTKILNPKPETKPTGASLGEFVGLDWLDPTHVDLFDICDLEELGLLGFLRQGAGVSEAQLSTHKDQLNTMRGCVLILYSRAIVTKPARLNPDTRTTPIVALGEEKQPVQFAPLPSASSQGHLPQQDAETVNPHLNILLAILALPILVLIIGAVLWAVLS